MQQRNIESSVSLCLFSCNRISLQGTIAVFLFHSKPAGQSSAAYTKRNLKWSRIAAKKSPLKSNKFLLVKPSIGIKNSHCENTNSIHNWFISTWICESYTEIWKIKNIHWNKSQLFSFSYSLHKLHFVFLKHYILMSFFLYKYIKSMRGW